MITVTAAAIEQIRQAAEAGGTRGMALRLAVSQNQDGSFHYGMGFDQAVDGDIQVPCGDVTVLVGQADVEMLTDLTLDYVELEDGQFNFIFLNPNDPHYSPPKA